MLHFALIFKPCLSARIFACVALLLRSNSDHPASLIESTLPLLRTFVNAEMTSLQDTEHTIKNEIGKKKKVFFCSFDNSSIITPVDTEQGSESIIENCIYSLHKVLQEVDVIKQKNINEYISVVIVTLMQLRSNARNSLLTECVKVSVMIASISPRKTKFSLSF